MKIAILTKSLKAPSSRIRAEELIPELKKYDIHAEIIPLPRGLLARIKDFRRAAADTDVVILQKHLLTLPELYLLRRAARRLAFDFDDAIYLRNAYPSLSPSAYRSFSRRFKFNQVVRRVDLTIAANPVLASAAREAGARKIVIVPSGIQLDQLQIKTDYHLGERIVIGWVGSRATLRYLEWLAEPLRRLAAEFPIIVRVVADRPPRLDQLEVDFIPWNQEEQYSVISQFDVGVMPLSNDPFSAGKASYKLLQFMACGVPSVCSAVGMNINVAGDNGNCLCANDRDEFYQHLKKLLKNESLRRELGEHGREFVHRHYSSAAAAELLATALRELCQTADSA